jgi:hypothetical protein
MKTKLFMLCTIVCAISLTCCEEEKPVEPITLRKVETGEVSEVTLTSATFHGVVNVDISQYHAVTFGIMLSQSKAELNEREGEMFKAKPLIGTDFKIEIGDLKPETKYYYCSWLLLNNTQYEFGDIKEFETLVPTPSTVITNPITMITTNSALAGGYVKDDGGASVTERGIVFGTSKEPTTSNYKVKNGSGIGEFTCNLTNLKDGTTYYVRAYAINKKGVAYGDEQIFTTRKLVPPTIETSVITNISYTSVTVGGDVIDEGSMPVVERGVVYSTSPIPTTSNNKVKSGSGTGSFTCNLTNLKDGTTYYVRAYAISDNINEGGTAYGDEVSFTTKAKKYENGHEYIDLGLSVKWATCNVGASAPEYRGKYYAWGETEIQTAPSSYWNSSRYTWDWYSWCFEDKYDLTKYCTDSRYGRPDNKTTLELSDDVAHVEWGGRWRMPTKEELTELHEKCKWEMTTLNGKKGYKLIGDNGNYIFMPAADRMWCGTLDYVDCGYYWSSSLNISENYFAWILHFEQDWYHACISGAERCLGLSVRPVCP